jgi:anaerobic selenocysteine-containing dehydrogenase
MAEETRFRTCNVCEAMCGLAIKTEGNRVTDVRADRDDVFSRGHICPKGPAMREVLEDPDRVRRPMKRTATGWKEIGWEQAFEEAAGGLQAIREKHGADAVGLYVGNPTVHNHGAILAVQGFARALGTKNKFDANSQDANPKLFACMAVYGDQAAITIPDVDRTAYFLMLGANPAASMGSVMTLGDVRGRLADIRARGGKIVLLDPRRTESAGWCDEHHFIRPGGDAAFLLAMLNVIFTSGRADARAIAKLAKGADELRAIAEKFAPERVADAIGVPADTIRRIARDFAAAPSAVAYGRVGQCTNEFGPVGSWLIEALNIVTGNFDRAGGAMFPSPAVDVARLGRAVVGNHYARWRSRVRGLPEFGGMLPASVMAEEMETEGPRQIRGFVTLAGNPALSTTNSERLTKALSSLEHYVAVDYYLNETTRHAHIILPPVHALERTHFDIVFHALAVRNSVKYSERVVEPAADSRDDYEILYELGMRMGGVRFGNQVIDRLARLAWKQGKKISPDTILDFLLRIGPYGDRFVKMKGLNLKRVREAPHGIDLGPMVPSAKDRVRTEDHRPDIAPKLLTGEIARVEAWLGERKRGGLVLIGRRHLRTNNSWMHNARSLVKGPDRSHLLMNPEDARRLGIAAGQEVRVQSRVGAVTAKVATTDDMMAGVVSLPHGYGHAAVADTLKIAGALTGANINCLTDDMFVEPVIGTAVLNGVPVTVEALGK